MLSFRLLEGKQDASAKAHRILERLETWRERFPFIVPEISVPGPSGQDERIIRQGITAIEQNAASICVDPPYGSEERGDRLPLTHDMADRPSNFRRRQRSSGDLVE